MRVRFWIDSSITEARTRIIATAWSSVKPSCWRRWTNFRVSKWWSFWGRGVVEKARAVEVMDDGSERGVALRCAQALRAKVEVAGIGRGGAWCLVLRDVVLLYWVKEDAGRMELAVQASRGMIVREATSVEAMRGAAMAVVDACCYDCVCCFLRCRRQKAIPLSRQGCWQVPPIQSQHERKSVIFHGASNAISPIHSPLSTCRKQSMHFHMSIRCTLCRSLIDILVLTAAITSSVTSSKARIGILVT